MESKVLKTGSIVMLVMAVYGLILGLMWLFAAKALTTPVFASFTGQTWSDFVTANAKAADLQVMSSRLTAAMALSVSILAVFLALTSYRKGEKWSWFAFLVPGIIVWGSNVAYYIALASLMSTVLMLIGLVLLVIGLVIPAKAILGGKAGKK